jgi:hypothetical protein
MPYGQTVETINSHSLTIAAQMMGYSEVIGDGWGQPAAPITAAV